ncbi:hypothetical protein BDC45DRAFT_570312 [Circinella umbellata]|nr:hypothetical protein BDC45DRAFT_570312 [Circinella umbellata]
MANPIQASTLRMHLEPKGCLKPQILTNSNNSVQPPPAWNVPYSNLSQTFETIPASTTDNPSKQPRKYAGDHVNEKLETTLDITSKPMSHIHKCTIQELDERPSTMDNVTLASLVAWYNYSKTRPNVRGRNGEVSEEENYNDDNRDSGDDTKVDDNGDGNAELVMMYSPCRDEEIDILLIDCETRFRQNQEAILANRREFTTFDDAILMEALENVEAAHDDAEEEGDPQRLLANPLDEYELDEENVDVMAEAGAYERVPYQETFTHPTRLDNDEYEALIALLNAEQRDFVLHMLTRVI